MSKSSPNSKAKPSQTVSSEAAAPATPKRATPLALLREELLGAEPNAPISVSQARVLLASLINLQNVVVSVMDTMDRNTEVMNQSHEATNQNFFGMLTALKQLAASVGVEIKGIEPDVDAETELPPPGTVKH